MTLIRRLFAVLVVVWALGAAAQRPQATPPSGQFPPIKTTTRLVVVDVIASDGEGRRVTDLQASDFVVLENGKAQKIASFARLPEQDTPAALPPPPLPADVFTNDPRYHTFSGPPMIMLLDLLNTPPADRPRVRTAMIDYVRKHLRPGQPTMVLLLGRELVLLQDFTSDPRILLAALDRVKGNPRDPKADRFQSDSIQQAIDHTSDPLTLQLLLQALELAKKFESAVEISMTTNRVETLLQASSAIARAAQGIPGRKSMIWVTAGFPVLLKNNTVAPRYPTSEEVVSFTDLLSRIAYHLNEAQIAMYPVDIRGLDTTAPLWTDTAMRQDRINRTMSRDNSPLTNENTAALEATQDSLVRVAEQTGGRAFMNRNDEDVAIATAADDGLHYYTIGYYPEDKRWNGKFRKIELKVARKGVNLRHRRGYFAEDPAGWQQNANQDLVNALQFDPLTTARVVFAGRIAKPVPGEAVNVEFMLPPGSIHFEPQNGRYVGSIDFHVAALTDDDKVAITAGKTSDFSLDPQKYREVMAMPTLSATVPLTLPPRKYRVRLLLRDNLTGHLGTVEIPLTVPKK